MRDLHVFFDGVQSGSMTKAAAQLRVIDCWAQGSICRLRHGCRTFGCRCRRDQSCHCAGGGDRNGKNSVRARAHDRSQAHGSYGNNDTRFTTLAAFALTAFSSARRSAWRSRCRYRRDRTSRDFGHGAFAAVPIVSPDGPVFHRQRPYRCTAANWRSGPQTSACY